MATIVSVRRKTMGKYRIISSAILVECNKDFRSYLLGIESLCGKHLIDVYIALENENFKTAVQEHQPLEKLETILMEEF
jgi:hypothetical protein